MAEIKKKNKQTETGFLNLYCQQLESNEPYCCFFSDEN